MEEKVSQILTTGDEEFIIEREDRGFFGSNYIYVAYKKGFFSKGYEVANNKDLKTLCEEVASTRGGRYKLEGN